jgi:hypothetical protein
MPDVNIEKFRLSKDEIELPVAKPLNPSHPTPPPFKNKRFIKGPLCLEWMTKAALLPGKALHVGLALSYLVGLKKTTTVKLAPSALRSFGVPRYSAYRSLKCLEEGKLVRVTRLKGQAPIVTVLDIGKNQEVEVPTNGTGMETYEKCQNKPLPLHQCSVTHS